MRIIPVLMLVFSLVLAGCSAGGGGGDERVVAQVNDYKMTVEDLKYELKNVPYDDEELLETEKGRLDYIDRLLEKEILLQEAQAQGLDREKEFMKSIENYWEQALLRLLLQQKSKEISGLIHVYDNEIEEYYRETGEDLSRSDVHRIIRQKKETATMDAWVQELKKRSRVKINEKILNEIF
ncbi:MAG: SurA N-terminal domain-containing protein [Candidatus Omnitrophica bacterium]|nr:SurA N-terminal domain-containing protein [Candidatus Omnitrophota bacterium]